MSDDSLKRFLIISGSIILVISVLIGITDGTFKKAWNNISSSVSVSSNTPKNHLTKKDYIEKFGQPTEILCATIVKGCTICGILDEANVPSPTTYVVVAGWNNLADPNNVPIGTEIEIPVWGVYN